jgi:hypothetical protein
MDNVQKVIALIDNGHGLSDLTNYNIIINILIRVSPVGIETGYGLAGWGSILGMCKGFFCIPQRPDRL